MSRPLGERDVGALLLFYEHLDDEARSLFHPFDKIDDHTMRSHLRETAQSMHISWGSFERDRLVGHGFVMRVKDRHPVFGVGVTAGFRGRGVGRSLAESVLGQAEANGARQIVLTVLKGNRRAISLYRRLGFKIRGNHTFRSAGDSHLMIREAVL